ncbi:MAG: lecithin retinol acyltransferase family protein [Fibrobacteres bacterium]|nr:lecithin retinol acyltransferase family protein [Fibrobacterota bacterium]
MNHMRFPPGSIIKRPIEGKITGKLLYHTGIYINDNRIINFNNEVLFDSHAIVRVDTIESFAKPYDITEVKLLAAPRNNEHSKRVIERAEYHLANPKGWNECYNVRSNNCEDFCKNCYEYIAEGKIIAKGPISQWKKYSAAFVGLVSATAAVIVMKLRNKKRNS